ncbi:hypothetical protein B0H17DRAFT_1094930 [Mycena rosella]|uniref:Uncharacterized protein n=1 Tax=Mycena rosella TaxID=1033263 RepID=A0AAD7CSA5_MYCRO|nr:hypothetical protein B0H17DRAFT_1094930 [Mycena rosella]
MTRIEERATLDIHPRPSPVVAESTAQGRRRVSMCTVLVDCSATRAGRERTCRRTKLGKGAGPAPARAFSSIEYVVAERANARRLRGHIVRPSTHSESDETSGLFRCVHGVHRPPQIMHRNLPILHGKCEPAASASAPGNEREDALDRPARAECLAPESRGNVDASEGRVYIDTHRLRRSAPARGILQEGPRCAYVRGVGRERPRPNHRPDAGDT